MKKTTLALICVLCGLTVLGKGKSDIAAKAATLDGFPFTKEQLKDIKESDSKYYIDVSLGNIELKNKDSNVRLFVKFYDKKTKKKIYTGDASFMFIGENEKTAPQAVTMGMSKLCPS